MSTTGCLKPPYFNWTARDEPNGAPQTDLLLGSDERMTNFLLAHFGFFLFNCLNVLYVLLFEGYALGNLRKNKMLQLAVIGCSSQVISCIAALKRYNMAIEYNIYGKIGMVTGIVAFFFTNASTLPMLFHAFENREKWCKYGTVAWFVFGLIQIVRSLMKWDDILFDTLRSYVIASTATENLIFLIFVIGLKKGTVSYDGLPKDSIVKIFYVLLGVGVVNLFVALRHWPIFKYPMTGFMFTLVVIANKFAGQMDLTTRATNTQNGESSALLG